MPKRKSDVIVLVHKLDKKVIIFCIFVVLSMYFLLNLNKPTFTVNNFTINIQKAVTLEERQRGLSNKDNLDQKSGMLFVFENEDYHCFWMKDMKFSIDIIWLGSNKKVVDKLQNVSPQTYPKEFCPKEKAKYVLEVNTGVIEDLNIQSDTQANF